MIQSILATHLEKNLSDKNGDPIRLLAALIEQIRPNQPRQIESATHTIQALCFVLAENPAYADFLRDTILGLFKERKPISIFVDSGIQPNSGFFSEISRRIGHKLLPDAVNQSYLKDLFALIFTESTDAQWVNAISDEVWLQLVNALRFKQADSGLIGAAYNGLLESTQVLSYRLSASGLEPELIRNHEDLENYESPFITQNLEIAAFVRSESVNDADINHLFVMLDQCRQVIACIRKNSAQTGTSIRLTFLLQRMTQQLCRLEVLLKILIGIKNKTDIRLDTIGLFKTLVYAESHKNDVRQHCRENIELMALRVTENASRTGEHYITETRTEYFALMRSAMGAGLIVGVMAMFKIMLAKLHLAPLMEAILFSLNYGFGFMLIHILHFTVATKQPAMTAAAIAASIDASDNQGGNVKSANMDKLVIIIAQTMRSQTIAIFGNVILAVPAAMLIAWIVLHVTGQHFVNVDKAYHLLADIDPFHSAALVYAAIAGVCLFLAGLIAGYHDNLAIYNKIPQRIQALRWLQHLLGEPRLSRIATYIENNLGALAGNFYFGCLLGGMAGIGVMLGLPIDIRHITFSSAFAGFAFVGLDFAFTWHTVLMAALGVLLIGTVNLLVSFSLALYVAVKSRKLSFAQWRFLIKSVLIRLNEHPAEFLLPPKKATKLVEPNLLKKE